VEWFENEGFGRDFYQYIFSNERFAAARDEVSRIIELAQVERGRHAPHALPEWSCAAI